MVFRLLFLFFSASVALGSTGLMVPGCDTALIHAGGGSTFDPRVGLDRNPVWDMQIEASKVGPEELVFDKLHRRDKAIQRDKMILAANAEGLQEGATRGQRFCVGMGYTRYHVNYYTPIVNVVNRLLPIMVYYAQVRQAIFKQPKPKGWWDRRKILSDALEAQWAHLLRYTNEPVPPLKEFIKEKYRADVLALLDQVEGRTALAHGEPFHQATTLGEKLLNSFPNPLEDFAEVLPRAPLPMTIKPLHRNSGFVNDLAVDTLAAQREYPLEAQSSERIRYFIKEYAVGRPEMLNADPEILHHVVETIWPHLLFFSKVEKHLQKFPRSRKIFSISKLVDSAQEDIYNYFPEKHIEKLYELLQKQLIVMFKNPTQRVPGLRDFTRNSKVLDFYEGVLRNVKESDQAALPHAQPVEQPKLIGQVSKSNPTEPVKLIGQKTKKSEKDPPPPPPQLASPQFLATERKPVGEIDAATATSEKVYAWGMHLQTDQIKVASNLLRFRNAHDQNAGKVIEPLVSKLETIVANHTKYSEDAASQALPLLTEALELSQKEIEQLKEVINQAKENLNDLDAALEPAERELARFENSELKYEPGSELESIHEALLLRRKVLKATRENANHVVVATRELERKLIEQRSRLDYLGQVFGNIFLYEGAKPGAILAAIGEVGE